MNYEIITSRWACPECGSAIRLIFSQVNGVEDGGPAEEYCCDRAACELAHELPEELTQEILSQADQEFSAAMERGYRVAEVWHVPAEQDQSPDESPPPEE